MSAPIPEKTKCGCGNSVSPNRNGQLHLCYRCGKPICLDCFQIFMAKRLKGETEVPSYIHSTRLSCMSCAENLEIAWLIEKEVKDLPLLVNHNWYTIPGRNMYRYRMQYAL